MIEIPHITVVMPVYNGAAYLKEQVDSILAQTGVRLQLIAADDGSQDGSLTLLHQMAANEPALEVIANDANMGLMRTLARLLALVDPGSGYLALADQDDIWDANKLEISIKALEARGAALVYSDVRVVNSTGEQTSPTYLGPRAIRPVEGLSPLPFVFRNPAIGHTIVTHAALAPEMARLPPDLNFHEAWLVGVACRTGPVSYIDQPLGGYRQHAGNVIGAKTESLKRIERLLGWGGSLAKRQNTRASALKALAELDPRLDKRLASLSKATERRGGMRFLAWPGFTAKILGLAPVIGLGPALTEAILFPFFPKNVR